MRKFQPLPEHLTLGERFFGKFQTFSSAGSVAPALVNLTRAPGRIVAACRRAKKS